MGYENRVTRIESTYLIVMNFKKAVGWSHHLVSEILGPGDNAIDATAGNGHDTLFLLNHVGETGRVYSFDIQQEAIDSTHERLTDSRLNFNGVTLINSSHAEMDRHIPKECLGSVKVIMFNFGYLPGGDHSITTKGETSRQAVTQALGLLQIGGRMVLTFYTGHPGGEEEAQQVTELLETLDPKKFVVLIYKFINLPNKPPYVIAVERVER